MSDKPKWPQIIAEFLIDTLILRKIPTFLFVRAKMLGFYSLLAGL